MNLRCDDRLLYEISKTATGSFCELPFALLLRAQWEHERSLQIEAFRGKAVKTVSVRRGVPINCDSNQAHEWLGRLAVAQRWVPEQEVFSALAEARRTGIPLGLVLIERRLIGTEELNKLLQQALAAKLLDLFSWPEGEFVIRFGPQKELTEQKIHVPQLILTGISRFMSGDLVTRQLAGVRHLRFHADHRPSEEGLCLSLNAPQQQIVDLLRESPHSLADVIRATALPLGQVERTIYALGVLGLVGTEHEGFGVPPGKDLQTTQEFAVFSG